MLKIDTIKVGMIETNCYIVSQANKSCWIIDPGNDSKIILEFVNREGYSPSKILLTHGHFDHIEAVSRIKQVFPNIKVYINSEDIAFLTNNKIWENYLGRPLISASYDELIKDGDIIEDKELKAVVISTPGHSAGSVCYLIEDNLFSGDTLFAYGGIGRTDLWNSSASAMRVSLKKLFSLEGNLNIYPGHGPATKLEHERKYRRQYV